MLKLLHYYKNISKIQSKHYCKSKQFLELKKPPWKVLFFGSDDFSLHSLKALLNECRHPAQIISTLEVVTCSQQNPVWKYSNMQNLKIHKWPPNLEKSSFDLGLVVSFGYLIPEQLIEKFPLGMLNVHGSLLPRWRGASPIVYALLHGDKETGITIMNIRPKKFDVGEIVYQQKIEISRHIEMPELYEKLALLGGKCLVNTLHNFDRYLSNSKPQPSEGVTYAPKLTPEFATIKWDFLTATNIYNLQRAVKSVLPLKTTWFSIPVRLFDINIFSDATRKCVQPGYVEYNRTHKLLIVECANLSWISVKRVGVHGKRIMGAADFYNGFISKIDKNTICCFQ
ncbi:methionyl-tRNA formyltransferase, mitochondrial [Euwallacea fornicatus]|uniref:methionyl-tRNA formyltransferase, mitochondrial n=1 Tax=Euwallacea fornicatus TaxID=995702 RepID=UPI00338F23FF